MNIRKALHSSQTLLGATRTAFLLALILFAALGLVTLIAGGVAELFGADMTAVFTFGKVLIALPMWAGVVLMFSFVCRM